MPTISPSDGPYTGPAWLSFKNSNSHLDIPGYAAMVSNKDGQFSVKNGGSRVLYLKQATSGDQPAIYINSPMAVSTGQPGVCGLASEYPMLALWDKDNDPQPTIGDVLNVKPNTFYLTGGATRGVLAIADGDVSTGRVWVIRHAGGGEEEIPFQWDPDLSSSDPCPQYGAFIPKITGVQFTDAYQGNTWGFVGTKPDTQYDGLISMPRSAEFTFINISGEVAPGGYGLCSRAIKTPRWVLYKKTIGSTDYIPAYYEAWGLAPGETTLYPGLPGFNALGSIKTDPDRMLVLRSTDRSWFGRAMANWWTSGTDGMDLRPGVAPDGPFYDGTNAYPLIRINAAYWDRMPPITDSNGVVQKWKSPILRTGDRVSYRLGEYNASFCMACDYTDDGLLTIKLGGYAGGLPRHWAIMNGTDNSPANGGSGLDYVTDNPFLRGASGNNSTEKIPLTWGGNSYLFYAKVNIIERIH